MGIFDLIALLANGKVDYVLVGGLAVALRGHARTTMDVDVVLAMDEANLERFIESARRAGLQPTIPARLEDLADAALIDRWRREKNLLAFSLRGPEAQATVLDVLVAPSVSYADLRRDATVIEVGPHGIPVASIDHLIALKTGTGRSKDEIDIDELRRIQARKPQ